MPTYKRPGVYVQEVPAAQSINGAVNSGSVAAFAGVATRGPLTPVLVGSWADYVTHFGDFSYGAYLPYTVFQFFATGGTAAYVTRIATNTATAATRSLTDALGSIATLSVTAINPGTWGNSLYVDVVSTSGGRFDLVVKFGGVANSNTVERFTDVTMDSTDSRYVVGIVNDASQYVTVADLHSSTPAPNNAPLAQVGTVLATAVNGGTPSTSDVTAAVNTFNAIDAPLVLNLAGITDATQISNTITWAEGTGRVFVVADLAAGLTPAQAVTAAAALTSSSYGACYYPWLSVNDPTKSGTVKKSVPPGGAVVGVYVATDGRKGPFQSPAGVQDARLLGVFATERTLTDDDLDLLNSSTPAVNVIRPVNGYGICIMGARTLKAGTVDRYIATRRSLIYIKKTLQDLTAPAVFQPNDFLLWTSLRKSVGRFLAEYRTQGGLRGASDAQAFFVKCDATNNPDAGIQNGEVHLDVGVALEYPAEFVVISVGAFEGGSTATES